MAALLGCIADDFTGATDLGLMLVRAGMRTVQTIGVPRDPGLAADADAVVIALKSRTIPAAEAVSQSLAAAAWLRARGARQLYFKYCSTFDSTAAGNIGPVADALLDALGAAFTIACPAFPENGRTIYKGHLFVGDVLLSDSPMRNHPLTPMTDANLVRVLAQQTQRQVGLVEHKTVAAGAGAIRDRFDALRAAGAAYAIVDALADDDLVAIGAACANLELVTAGSGLALGLPQNYFAAGLITPRADAAALQPAGGKPAVLAGSCSAATREQVRIMSQRASRLRPRRARRRRPGTDGGAGARGGRRSARCRPAVPDLLQRRTVQGRGDAAGARAGTGRIAGRGELSRRSRARSSRRGVRRLVVAGGETSGAVVKALGVEALAIGPQIDPGVPWTMSIGPAPRLALALKSGNFGAPDFFEKALGMMP